ncbi:MAG: hypothetical protein LAT55_08955 [Opitutales bacterium]|nr:hypothetical protein [Opitutales bacterium]
MTFRRDDILYLLRRLSTLAKAEGTTLEVAFYGGSCLLLAYDYQDRQLTKDIDAIFQQNEIAKALIHKIAKEEDLPEDWIDAGVRQFLSPVGTTYVSRLPELKSLPNLKISFPTAEYLIAMKIRSSVRARFGYEGDLTDLRFLARKTGLRSMDEVQAILDRFFDDEVIPVRAEEVLQEVIDETTKKT